VSRARWLVTNGHAVVGPVSTESLLRGIERGTVGPDCLLRQPGWAAWRSLRQVREVSAWFREEALPVDAAERWLDCASDRGELVHWALRGAMELTHASCGLGYVRRQFRYVSSCVAGEGAAARELGEELPWGPIEQRLAAAGCVHLGEVVPGDAISRTIARRLAPGKELEAVALVPLRGSRRLLGFLELGRSDHVFRQTDRALLEQLAWGVRWRAA
jgi:hypothetical protein